MKARGSSRDAVTAGGAGSTSARARALVVGSLGAFLLAGALGTTFVPALTGCTTHQCDASSYDYRGGFMVDPDTYVTTQLVDQPWIDYGPNTTVRIHFPDVGRAPTGVSVFVGTGGEPNEGADFKWGESFAPAAGQLALVNFLDSQGVWVTNGSCASYYAYVRVGFVSSALTLFGGTDGTTPLGDSRSWNGSDWQADEPTVAPSPRSGAVMGTVKNRTYLFGGFDGAAPLADTWAWDGVSWALQSPPRSPPARYDAASGVAVAIDSHGQPTSQLVVFGGRGVAAGGVPIDLDDTWAWDGTAWTEQVASMAPAARSGAAAAGLSSGDLVVFGGTSSVGAPLGDTWIWQTSGWSAGASSPPAGPSARAHAAAAPFNGGAVLFGGNDGSRDLDDTWVWAGSAWREVMPTNAPSPRSSATLATFRSQAVLFGGFQGNKALADTWTWDGSGWTEQTSATSLGARGGAAAVAN